MFSFLEKYKREVFYIVVILAFFAVYFFVINYAFGSTIDDLKAEISARNSEVDKLKKEIDELDSIIKETQNNANTLKNELSKISNTILQLDKKVKIKETEIKSAALNISRLEIEIKNKENNISFNKDSIGEMLKVINEKGIQSPVEILMSSEAFSDGWSDIDSLEGVQRDVIKRIKDLESIKQSLIKNKDDLSDQKKELEKLKKDLVDQKNIASQNKGYKNTLLAQTKNQESNYKALLKDKEARKRAVEIELFDYESQLKVAIDPNSYPAPGTKSLEWPTPSHTITQVFGNTEFSKAHAAVYNGKGHNGIDLRASVGTPITSAASGKVMGTGNTDTVCAGASYGKWVLVKHKNGLSTLYAHLSLIKVKEGDDVLSGSLLGYSGDTGYATGPHLHFAVYASMGVRIDYLKSKNPSCGTYRMPLAPFNAYLNPQSYL